MTHHNHASLFFQATDKAKAGGSLEWPSPPHLTTPQMLGPPLTFITDTVSQRPTKTFPHLPMLKGKKGAFLCQRHSWAPGPPGWTGKGPTG